MERVFLDANVLFSAAYSPRSRITRLWGLPETQLVTSTYAAAEATRNVIAKCPDKAAGLSRLLTRTGMIADSPQTSLPPGIALPEKDVPILQAAIACRAAYLLTGDSHFEEQFGRVVDGVMILRPGDYLRLRQRQGE